MVKGGRWEGAQAGPSSVGHPDCGRAADTPASPATLCCPLQVWVLGTSPEFGHCKATKKVGAANNAVFDQKDAAFLGRWFVRRHSGAGRDQPGPSPSPAPTAPQQNGEPCRMPVNATRCPFCPYHVQVGVGRGGWRRLRGWLADQGGGSAWHAQASLKEALLPLLPTHTSRSHCGAPQTEYNRLKPTGRTEFQTTNLKTAFRAGMQRGEGAQAAEGGVAADRGGPSGRPPCTCRARCAALRHARCPANHTLPPHRLATRRPAVDAGHF